MSYLKDTPLGRTSEYSDEYMPALLCPVPRWDARESLELDDTNLPFHGSDLWTAYELSWLNEKGKPLVALAELRIPCFSPNIVESKSLKLYLNSFANSRFDSQDAVRTAIEKDVSQIVGVPIEVLIFSLADAANIPPWEDRGQCVDTLDVGFEHYDYRPELLLADQGAEQNGQLYSHLLRSHCPVTNQPDWATVVVRYTGRAISPASFLRYVVSLRNHQGFHEQIIEQMYMDLMRQCQPRHLTVYGRFTRRGGIDINPFRSNFEQALPNRRTVRQ
ncbi:7-cyano-7-deazaguanine reductase [Alcanivorax hongdengensis A-11-3]|uniref:NADPH-dependent 7-cyano-7-deazaguanine reductase n=1 Tax=Alcanivorax hongdengensis A-11-3 TaxID=1177179 RepID=L0WAM5_9GAMM|nr:NADPH-dependent 7-cyano-7-deazaguanine reductase QueF [Alcanivorax hongdengensis]EKF72780.1 7-cyano-7-deazaguanine reductase [Alcanivorax hongdengensis A-11-3]